jgi:hypothetical protein
MDRTLMIAIAAVVAAAGIFFLTVAGRRGEPALDASGARLGGAEVAAGGGGRSGHPNAEMRGAGGAPAAPAGRRRLGESLPAQEPAASRARGATTVVQGKKMAASTVVGTGGDRRGGGAAPPEVAAARGVAESLREQARRALPERGPSGGGELLPGEVAAGDDAEESPDGSLLSLPLTGTIEAEGDEAPIQARDLVEEEGEVGFGPNSVLEFPVEGNLRTEAGTISFDVRPDWDDPANADRSFLQVGHGGTASFLLVNNSGYLRFIVHDDSGTEFDISYPIAWKRDEWHSVTATWGEAQTRLYVDGALVGQNIYPGELTIAPGSRLYIGSDVVGRGTGAAATIQNFKIEGRSFDPTGGTRAQ